MKAMTRCLAVCVALVAPSFVHAVTPTAVWTGNDLADGVAKNGMTLHLNGNTSANGVVTIGSSSVYVETGMTDASPNAGTEATVVVTWENVSPNTYGAVATFTTASQTDAVGVECFGYSGTENNQFYWIQNGNYSGWSSFYTYPNDLASHKVAFACASPNSGTGSGGYNGSVIAVDGAITGSSSSITASGNCIKRINVAGYQTRYPQTGAKITRIAVYTSALSTADLKTVTGEDEPEPVTSAVWGNVGNASASGVATTVALKSYSSLNVDFCAIDNISQTVIGSNGLVKITKVRLFADNNASVKPAAITISQGNTEIISESCSFVGGQKVYGANWPTMSSHYWTRKAIDATFTSEAQFDTTNPITISFTETTIFAIQPVNSVCVGSSYTPAIEITGNYSPVSKPIVSGSACVYDWTFTNTVEQTGSKTISTATGSQKTANFTGDNNAKYTNLTNGLYTALLSFVRPYVNVQAAGGQSFAYFGTVSPTHSAVVFSLGQKAGSLFVATGTNSNEIVLARTASGLESVNDSTLGNVVVDSPVSKPHLYVLYLSSDKMVATLTVDGETACTHVFASAPSISTGMQICGMYANMPANWNRDENETTAAINCFRIFDHELSAAECDALIDEFEPLWPEGHPLPEITKDPTTHTWIVDTTKATYDFSSTDISDLKSTAWEVTLKSQSNFGATVNFGSQSSQQLSHFVIESGTHNLTWLGDDKNINFNRSGTGDDPSILILDGATLNFIAKDITGWQGEANVKTGNVIRVNGGGTLNLLQSGTSTHYYQGRYWLDPGATLNADSYTEQKLSPTFCLNGGVFEGSEQLYMPDSSKGSDAATISAVNGIKLANDVTAGLGVHVGKNSTMEINAPIMGTQPLQKWGAGTLSLSGVLTGYTGALTVSAGTLELAQPTLGGTLTMASGTIVNVSFEGKPTEGDSLLTATVLDLADDVVVKVNGAACPYTKEDGAIKYRTPEKKPGQLRISEICPKSSTTISNKYETGWIELVNTGDTEVDTADYELARFNRGKKAKAGDASANLPSIKVPGRSYVLVYCNEYFGDEAKIFEDTSIYFPNKINPKKYPMIQLYQGTSEKVLVDSVIIPVDCPDGYSVVPEDTEGVGKEGDGTSGTVGETVFPTALDWSSSVSFDTGSSTIESYTDPSGKTLARNVWDLTNNQGQQMGVEIGADVVERLVAGNSYTIDLWFCLTQNTCTQSGDGYGIPIIYSRGTTTGAKNGVILYVTSEGQVAVQPRTAIGASYTHLMDSDANYLDGNWHHLVYVGTQLENGRVMVQLDGTNFWNSTTDALMPLRSEDPLAFGHANGSASWAVFKGYLADLRIYPGNNILGSGHDVIDQGHQTSEYAIGYDELEDGATRRLLCPTATPGADNIFVGAVALGPQVSSLYGVKDATDPWVAFPQAKPGTDYTVTLPINPVSTNAGDAIKRVRLLYRADQGDILLTDMVKGDTSKTDGQYYTATIPSEDLPLAGHLVRWAAEITDGAGNVWRAPSFNDPDGAYEWFGTIVEPTENQVSKTLQTFHLFGEPTVVDKAGDGNANYLMNKQYDSISGTYPYGARVGIYDSTTGLYYDNVRIDLRGNTTAGFKKKSHGVRFNKSQPLTCTDPVTGMVVDGLRKTSFVAEYADPSYVRQILSTKAYADMGVRGPFDYPVRLNINGAFYQLAGHSTRFTDELLTDGFGFDEFDYAYKSVGKLDANISTTGGGCQKKLPDDGNEGNLSFLKAFTATFAAAVQGITESTDFAATPTYSTDVSKTVVKSFDLPSWINYIAMSRTAQECDDVWANMCIAYDAKVTGTWIPLAYDLHLSWGQWYYNDDVSRGRIGCLSSADDFKSHPFYGGCHVLAHRVGGGTINGGNCGVEAIFQNAKFRRLYVRRLRTIIDNQLCEVGTAKEDTPLWVYAENVASNMVAEAAADRSAWGCPTSVAIWDWSGSRTFAQGLDELWSTYFVPRRVHLYETHSYTNTVKGVGYGRYLAAGIPAKQSAIADLKAKFDYKLIDGGIKITNTNGETVDMSGWVLSGPFEMTVPHGTVIDETDGEVYFVTNRVAYVAANDASLTDQVIVGNATAGDATATVYLRTAEGEEVIGPKAKSEQAKFFRLWGFCGCPKTGNDTTGEFIILTNLNAEAELDISGANLNICKDEDSYESSKCNITFAEGAAIAAGSYLRLDITDSVLGWSKITNGGLNIRYADADGVVIYELKGLSQSAKGVKEEDKFLFAVAYNQTADDWEAHDNAAAPVKPTPPAPPAEDVVLTGAYPDGTNIVLTADTTIVVSNATFGVKLAFTSNFVATVRLPADTSSTAKSITSEGRIILEGEGALSVSNNTTLVTCGGLTIEGGTLGLELNDDSGKTMVAAEMLGSYIQNGGAVNLRMHCTGGAEKEKSAYGFRWKDRPNCVVELNGGTFGATMHSDYQSVAFKANDVSNTVLFGGAEVTGEFTGVDGRLASTDGEIAVKSGAKVVVNSTATGSRVFKSDTFIRLRKAQVTVHALGAGSEIFSCDDTIDAGHDSMVLVLESTDDCFSAQTNIIVSAGVVYGVSTENDVLDSNGQMTISGGTVLAYALTPGHEGIDTECYPDNGLDHTLTISGGTVVALGGTGSAWPTNVVFTQRVYTNLACSATTFSEKYLVLDGEFAKTTVKLPRIADDFILLATAPALTADPTVGEDAPSVEPIAANVPAWVETKSPQQFVRFYAIYGNTTEGSEEAGTLGDVGEYIVLTNLSAELTVDLTGLTVNVEKLDDWTKKGESGSKCLFTLTGGTIPPGGSVRLDQATYWGGAKQKITNGDLYIALTDSTGAAVQKGYASNDLYPECDGNGAALVAKTFGKTMAMTTADWKPSFAWFVFTVGESGATITGLGETLASETTLTLPTELGKVPVVAIADGALVNGANLRYLAFKGAPLMCSSAAFPTGVIGFYDAAQAGWDEAIVDGRWNGLVMLNGSEETISVNIAAGYPVSGTEKHGLFGVKGDQWLNVVGTWGSETTRTIDAGAVTAVVEGVSVARTNVVIQAAAKNTYKYDAANQETFFKGYLDDGGNRARVTVENVPYSKYDVIVYATSDQEGRALSPVTVNGVAYTWSGETSVGSSTWGATCALQPQLGQNALWIPNQTALTLAIVGGPNANNARGGIAAIQIVNRGEVDEEPGRDFLGTMSKDATLETVAWANGPFEAGRKNTATLMMAGSDELKLMLTDPFVTLKSLALTGDTDLWLEASEYPKNIATLDLAGVSGLVTYGWPVYTLESSSANVAYAGGAGTAESPVLLNPKGGRLWLRGGMYYIANNSWSVTSTTVDIDDSTLDFGDGIFGVGTAAYTIGGASEVTAASFVLSQGGNSRTSVFTLKDDAVLNVTGETIIDKNTSSIMFGHWNGPSTFTITNNAVFKAPKAEVLVGKTGNDQTINVAGGVFEAYGIKASANATGNNRLNLSGGELKLGTGGISTYKAGRTIAISVTDSAQITATADMTIDQPITVAAGVTLALGSENGATFTVGADTFAEASAGRIEVTKGNVKLSGEGVLGTQKLKVNEGATVTLALADFGEITEEGVVPFDVESGDTETFSRVVISDGAQHPYVKFDTDPESPTFGQLLYTAPRCELTGLHIAEICGKPTAKDPNGRESGWVELVNYGPESVNLRDYKLYRLNYGKKDKSADAQKMLDRVVQPGERTLVYMSEDYETAEDYGGDGVTVRNFGGIMVIPTKINPKKYPCVTLYDADDKVIDKVVVPCELDDNGSVLVGITTNKTERFVTFTPTPLAEKDFATALAIGPEVNGLYGKKDYANDLQSLNRHDGFAPAGVGFKVRLPINPVCESTLKADKIKSVRLVYRVFDPAGSEVKSVALTSSKPTADEESRWGKKSGVWEGEIPADDMIAGKLVQYAAMITDGSGAEWRAPRFVYPELGYEWYGVVVDPGEAVRTDKLQTFLFFIDNVNKAQMDTDADQQTLPYCARVAVYDTQTHTYYDNVRIDLRGNTSKGFTKKSHGLRFNKVAPLVCTDPTTGEELEVRKTSFISEFADPTYMRQMLSFWMLRDAGCKTPFDYPARLYLNGEYYQLAFHSVRFSDDMIENVYGLNKHVYSYKNIGTFGGSTSAGGIEKKTPDDDNESDLTLLNAYCARFNVAKNGASLTTAQKAALDATVVTNFDIAAWINYIAATRISSECDDVWANLSGYIDQYDSFYNPKGDNMLHPLAYDMNLSWGQHFRDGGMGQTGLKADKDWFKSHPFYGGFVIRAHSTEGGSVVGNANYAYETIFQNPRNRELLVRRLRTLTDRYLGAPGTPKEETPVWQRLQYYRDLIADDAATDRAKWPIDGTANVINNWPSFPADLDAGLEDLWENYIVPRRVHLYDTHSATNTAKAVGYGADLNAGIPLAQASAAAIRDSVAIANLGNDGLFHDEEVLVLTNKSAVAVDISDWQLKYSVTLKLPGGTVIPAGGCVYVPANRRTFIEKLVAEGRVSDQIVTPSAVFDVTGAIALVADDGTEIVKAVPPTNESEYLRLHSFCGNTADGADGDTGEWFVLTNISDTVDLDLAGVTVCFLKEGDPEEGTSHCHVTFEKGTIAAGASLRCDQADYAGKGWVKIQNNKLGINLSDSYGSPAQTLAVAQKDYPAAYGGGGWLVADSTAKTVGKKEWHAETSVIPVQPGEAPEMKAKTAEEAQAEIAKYEVRLTDEDKAAGVEPEMLMMVPVAVSNETTGVVTYYAQVAVNPEVVAPPEVGEDEAGTIKPIEIASDESGEVTVSVGINNATLGLWYGYEVSESLGTQAFANDVPSFERAKGEAVKITGSRRSGNAAFFRVKVLPVKPLK